jgi:hypothetical protein
MAKNKDDVQYLEQFDTSEHVPLRPEDWEFLSKRSVELRAGRATYENQKKYFADMQKGVEAELDEVTQIIAAKKIYKAIKACYALDFKKNEKRLYQVVDGELVYLKTEKLTDSDKQLRLGLVQE